MCPHVSGGGLFSVSRRRRLGECTALARRQRRRSTSFWWSALWRRTCTGCAQHAAIPLPPLPSRARTVAMCGNLPSATSLAFSRLMPGSSRLTGQGFRLTTAYRHLPPDGSPADADADADADVCPPADAEQRFLEGIR